MEGVGRESMECIVCVWYVWYVCVRAHVLTSLVICPADRQLLLVVATPGVGT